MIINNFRMQKYNEKNGTTKDFLLKLVTIFEKVIYKNMIQL